MLGTHGILPTRGSLTLDLVFVATLLIVMVMTVSIGLVRFKRQYRWHRNLQLGTAVALLVTLVVFEVDMQVFTDWRALAEPSPFYSSGAVGVALAIHLGFAIPTPFLWAWTIVDAMRRFGKNATPNGDGKAHRIWGRISAVFMLLTTTTAWVFYYLAFVAK